VGDALFMLRTEAMLELVGWKREFNDGPPPVRRWLRGPAKVRIIGSAYHPADDADYAITVGSWRGAFDAVPRLDRVTPSRLLAAAPGPAVGQSRPRRGRRPFL